MRRAAHETLEKALGKSLWEKRVWSSNPKVSGGPLTMHLYYALVLCTRAAEITLHLAIEDFNASDGWLVCFKTRHGLVFRSVCGESEAVDVAVCTVWQIKKLQDILEKYEAQDIYNVDETGLFLKLLPAKIILRMKCARVEN